MVSILQHSVILFRCAMSYEGGKMLTYYTYESISNTRIFALLAATKHINLQQQNTQIHLPQHALVRLAAAMAMPSCGLPHCVQCGLPQHEFVRLAAAYVRAACRSSDHAFVRLAAAMAMPSCGLPHCVQCGLPQHEFVRLAAAYVRAACRSNDHAFVRLAAAMAMRSCGLPQHEFVWLAAAIIVCGLLFRSQFGFRFERLLRCSSPHCL